MTKLSSAVLCWLWCCLLLLLTTTTPSSIFVHGRDFEPYDLNGGLVCGVAGKNFAIVCSDTRMFGGGGYLLQSRNHLSSRLWSVSSSSQQQQELNMEDLEQSLITAGDNEEEDTTTGGGVFRIRKTATKSQQPPIYVGSSGCTADCTALKRVIKADLRAADSYFSSSTTSTKISCTPSKVANLLSQVLYLRRGFPYYCFCVVGGLDTVTKQGQVFVYDAIGSYEQVAVACAGTGREALQPILDRLFEGSFLDDSTTSSSKSASTTTKKVTCVQGTATEAIGTLLKAYRSVSEREIGVGDKLVFHLSEYNPNEDNYNCQIFVLPLKEH